MYYRLKEPYAFRGFKRLPYAIRAERGNEMFKRPFFLGKEEFLDLLYCNGTENINIENLSDKAQKIIKEFIGKNIIEESEDPMQPLQLWQRYHVYPSKYIESVHWSITGKCNFRCRHCMVSAPDNHHAELSGEDCLKIIEQISECGVHQVDITGGEPFVRKDYDVIFKELSEHGIFIRTIFTNASLLDEKVLDTLEKYRHHPLFQLSFDGLGHHDWLRNVAGAEKQAEAAFSLLNKRGFKTAAAMCIHRGNKDCLRDTANYLASLGVDILRLNSPQELGLWKEYSKEYALTEDEIWQIYKEYIPHYFEDGMPIDIELDGYFSCKKGSTDYKIPYIHHASDDVEWSKVPYCESMQYNAYISAEGRLTPCMGFADTVLGNRFPSVLEEHMGELTLNSFYADTIKTKVSDLLDNDKECRSCPHLNKCCGGCMLESMTEDGEYRVRDKRICYFYKNIGEHAVNEVADTAIKARNK